jgi:hypothetical protein
MMNNIELYKWGIEHGILFKGGKSAGAGYQGPSESDLAARRAEERAENNRLRQLARLEQLDDQRRAAEEDKLTAGLAKKEQDKLIAERESKEEMVGDESAGQAEVDSENTADIMRTGERYGTETRSTDNPGLAKKKKNKE